MLVNFDRYVNGVFGLKTIERDFSKHLTVLDVFSLSLKNYQALVIGGELNSLLSFCRNSLIFCNHRDHALV